MLQRLLWGETATAFLVSVDDEDVTVRTVTCSVKVFRGEASVDQQKVVSS